MQCGCQKASFLLRLCKQNAQHYRACVSSRFLLSSWTWGIAFTFQKDVGKPELAQGLSLGEPFKYLRKAILSSESVPSAKACQFCHQFLRWCDFYTLNHLGLSLDNLFSLKMLLPEFTLVP